jgi:hypothetical protein
VDRAKRNNNVNQKSSFILKLKSFTILSLLFFLDWATIAVRAKPNPATAKKEQAKKVPKILVCNFVSACKI